MTTTSSGVIERRDIWQTFWHIAASDRLFAVSLLGLIVLLVLSALLPQTPQDTFAYSRWLSGVQTRFGAATGILTTLGLFDVAHSIALRALAALLSMTLSLRLIERLQELRATARRHPPPETLARHIDSDQPAAVLGQRLLRYRVHTLDGTISADRYPWANWAAVAAYGGALLMLAGLLLSTLTDWRADALNIAPDSSTSIAGTAYRLRAVDLGAQGEVDLALLQNEQIVARGRLRPEQPWIVNGIQFFVQETQPALRVSGQNENGEPVALQIRADSSAQDQLLLIFDPHRPDPSFAAPAAQLFVQVAATETGDHHVSAIGISDGKLIAEENIRAGEELRIAAYRFTFDSAAHVLIGAVHAPAQWVIMLGTILALAGLSIVALYPARRIWLTPFGTGTRILCDDPDFDIEHWIGSTNT